MKRTVLLLTLACVAAAASAQPAPHYHIVKEVKLGSTGGWDYLSVDSRGHRLYLSRGNHVLVVDTRSMAVENDIIDTPGVHIAVAVRKHGVGFTSNGGDSTANEFDLNTLKTIKSIKVGARPDAMIYDPFSDRIFTFNAGSQDATAINAATGDVVGSIPLDGKPEFPATDGHGKMFVNIEDKSEITQFDPIGLKVVNTWPIAPVESPSGLAIDTKDHLLFATGDNQQMAVVDYNTGKVVASPAIGNGPDAAGFDPGKGYAFSSNGQDGTLTVVGQDSSGNWVPVQTLKTQRSARTMALDPSTHKIYLVCADFGAMPAGTGESGQRRRRPPMIPGSFTVLVVSP